ncbi:MAG: molybdate ABC transporter substrate-binding protein, partial [Acidimicrobiia bacterium]
GGGEDSTSGSAPSTSGPSSSTSTVPKLEGPVTVLAAASLTEAFTELGTTFETDHPGTKLSFSFGASSTLAQQAIEGAPGDLLFTADEANMKKAIDAGVASDPKVFARNRLALLVAKGNPGKVETVADLAEPGVVFVLCAATVPCGKYGAEALAKAGVSAKPKSLEENVKGVVSKVSLGEADAGIVYVTDAKAAGDKAIGVEIADEHNVVAIYPLAALKDSANVATAKAFADFVLSSAGQAILAKYGFLAP